MAAPFRTRDDPVSRPPHRYVRLVFSGDVIRCPHGHKFSDVIMPEDAFVRCKYRWPTQDGHAPGECGQLLYLWAGIHGFGGPSAHGILAIGITTEELRRLDRKGLSAIDVLKILGLRD